MKIIAVRDSESAPCAWLICQVDEDGDYDISAGQLVQDDWSVPPLAANWGYVPCEHNCGTDGTVACKHHTVGEMISAAWTFLEEHGSESIDDPGYFGDMQ